MAWTIKYPTIIFTNKVKNGKDINTPDVLKINSLYHKGQEISKTWKWKTNFLEKYEGFIKRSNLNLNVGNYDLYFEIKTNFMDWEKTKTPRPKNSGINREDAIRIVACYNIEVYKAVDKAVDKYDAYVCDTQYFITDNHYSNFKKLKISNGVIEYDI